MYILKNKQKDLYSLKRLKDIKIISLYVNATFKAKIIYLQVCQN